MHTPTRKGKMIKAWAQFRKGRIYRYGDGTLAIYHKRIKESPDGFLKVVPITITLPNKTKR